MPLTQEHRRQKIGKDNTDARRASGRAMRDDMRALAESNKAERTLPVLPVRGGQPSKRGRADWKQVAVQTGGGGVDSPLTEQAGTRIYHDASTLTVSNTFLEAMEIRMLKQVTFKDASENPLVMIFSDVVAGP